MVVAYKLAIKLATQGIGSQRLREGIRRRLFGLLIPNFDQIGEGSADRGGVLCLAGSESSWQQGNLTVFGHQACQRTMNLCKEVLKGKCRGQPNVNPARADCDQGADL
jgi:hypothetical protein